MSPPERTFGPIGWKGFASGDDADDQGDDGGGRSDGGGGGRSDGGSGGRSDSGGGPSTSDRRSDDGERDARAVRSATSGGRAAGEADGTNRRERLADGDEDSSTARAATDDRDPFEYGNDGDSKDGNRRQTSTTGTEIREERYRRVQELSGETRRGSSPGTGNSRDRSDETPGGDADGSSEGIVDRATPDAIEDQIHRARARLTATLRDREAKGTDDESAGLASDGAGDVDGDPGGESADTAREIRERRSRATKPATAQSGSRDEPDRGSPAAVESETRDDGQSSRERTVGPIGLKGRSREKSRTESSTTAGTASTADTASTANPATTSTSGADGAAVRRDRSQSDSSSRTAELTRRVPWSVSFAAIGVGVGLLVFLDILTMMVPLLAAIGSGVVAGFVAGYIAGGTIRGGLHALAVGIVGGVVVGYLTAMIGALLGLYMEPATLLGNWVGPVVPQLGAFGAWAPVLLIFVVAAMVAVDATIAGVVGGTVRSAVDRAR